MIKGKKIKNKVLNENKVYVEVNWDIDKQIHFYKVFFNIIIFSVI